MRSLARVALLGQTVVRELFRGDDPVGQTIRIRNSPYLVVGVLARKGQSFDGRDQDDTVLVPLTTAQRKLYGTPFPGSVRFMLVQGVSEEQMGRTEREMTAAAQRAPSHRARRRARLHHPQSVAPPRTCRRKPPASCRCCWAQ